VLFSSTTVWILMSRTSGRSWKSGSREVTRSTVTLTVLGVDRRHTRLSRMADSAMTQSGLQRQSGSNLVEQ
jgi:hypothetical protein